MGSVFQPDQTRYELEQKLGEGLNSAVWRAIRFDYSGENKSTVALKLPKDQTSVPLLRREFEILQRVRSNHCVRVIAWESRGGEPALALEWIDGVTLLDLARKAALGGHQRDEIVRQIHLGLIDLKNTGLAHGDLHPGNIMVDRDGVARLIDFASGRTSDGHLQAAPAFVAPELLLGADFSHEADLFALNVVGEHMLDGYRRLSHDKPSMFRAEGRERPREMKPAKENPAARAEVGLLVSEILAAQKSIGTQLIAPEDLPERAVSPLMVRGRSFFRWAAAFAAALALTAPVFAEDPLPEPRATAQIHVTSQSWMKITINGRAAGFAPLTLTRIRSGQHRIEWRSASAHGEFRITVRAGDTVRLAESRRSRGRLEVR